MMKKTNKVRWDPIIAKLADNSVKQKICVDVNNHDLTSMIKEKWVVAVEKRRSKEDFQTFIHALFDVNGPKVKYHNPDAWLFPPKKKKDGNS